MLVDIFLCTVDPMFSAMNVFRSTYIVLISTAQMLMQNVQLF